MKRSLLRQAWDDFPAEMNRTSGHKFRSRGDVIPFMLALAAGLDNDEGITDYTTESRVIAVVRVAPA